MINKRVQTSLTLCFFRALASAIFLIGRASNALIFSRSALTASLVTGR